MDGNLAMDKAQYEDAAFADMYCYKFKPGDIVLYLERYPAVVKRVFVGKDVNLAEIQRVGDNDANLKHVYENRLEKSSKTAMIIAGRNIILRCISEVVNSIPDCDTQAMMDDVLEAVNKWL